MSDERKAPPNLSFFWLGDPKGVMQPLKRIAGPFKEAWAARLKRPVPPVHVSKFVGRGSDDRP